MSTITLDQIEAKQSELASLIAKLKEQATMALSIPAATIELRPGERYSGLMLDAEGKPSHHLVLLPNKTGDVTWQGAKDFAAEIGGELPTRREQALLFANLPDQFDKVWHWSGEQSSVLAAWIQYFYDGSQSNTSKYGEFAVRLVRRLPL
jgi:hypothetical protein